jgi:hypothetical protein
VFARNIPHGSGDLLRDDDQQQNDHAGGITAISRD